MLSRYRARKKRGQITTDFGTPEAAAYAVAIQVNGKIIVAGYSEPAGLFADFTIVRYDPDGKLDTTFGAGGSVTTDFTGYSDIASAVAIQADGKIVAAGQSQWPGSTIRFGLARYNSDGSLDVGFDGDGLLTTDFTSGRDRA